MTPFVAEFIGTLVLIVFGNGVVASAILKDTKAENAGWLVITIGWGLAVSIAVYAVGAISGAHLNPAVTLALASTGDFAWALVPQYIIAQVLGALVGACIVWLHFLPHWKRTKDQGTQLAVFATGPAIRNTWTNLLSEISGTFFLIMGLLFIGANKFAEGLNPLVVGALVVAIGLSLGATTGYAINPARDFGPRLAHFILPIAGKGKSDWQYAWIPIVGPLLGGTLAALSYKAIFAQQVSVVLWAVVIAVLGVVIMAVINQHNSK